MGSLKAIGKCVDDMLLNVAIDLHFRGRIWRSMSIHVYDKLKTKCIIYFWISHRLVEL